ncbi:PAS domain S-box protein [Sulfurimonas sp.]|uniref:PAS domain-containing sensor histidine kinase n=1 Tax=Sulfurimonas sp. TaxID=2022749 RepID=UPI0039E67424
MLSVYFILSDKGTMWVLPLVFISNILVLSIYLHYKRITQRLLSSIKKNEQRVKYAIEATKDGFWDWNLKTNEVYYSPRWKEILGYKDDEISNEFQSWENLIHPDDIEKAKEDILINHQVQGILYENKHRLQHKDGHWVLVLNRGQTIFDDDGNAMHMTGFHTDVTEQERVEEELLTSKQQFEHFMENIPGMVSIRDNSMGIIYANSALTDFTGLENIIGKRGHELISKKAFEQGSALAAESKDKGNAEAIIKYTDSKNKDYVFRVMMFEIGKEENSQTGTMYFDITDQYKNQHEIAKFKQILESSPVSIVITDVDGNIEYVNPYFCNLSGYSLEDVIGHNPRIQKSKYHTDEDYKNLWDKVSHNKVWSGTFKNIKKNGDEYWESAIIAPVMSETGKIINYIGIKQEITEQVHLREELADKEEIIIAQSRHAAMGEMIGMIAHQWRQPISVIAMGANNLLIDIDLNEVSQENIIEESQSIIKQTEYLSKTIDDFRNFFRPDKEVEEVTVEEIVYESKKVIGKSLEHKQILLSINNDTSYRVKTYSRELLQVFINLFKNAGEVLYDNRETGRKIDVNITNDEEYVIVRVCDNGGGIDNAIINKIFNPYFSTKDKKTGTGLGLYMSKTIIEKHLKGKIEVSNTEDGACFEISIPIKWKK